MPGTTLRAARRRLAPALVGIGAASVVGGAFLPWVASGDRVRNSFEVVRAGRSLGVLDGDLERAGALAWYLVPVVGALTLLGLSAGFRRTAAVLAAVAGVAGLTMAFTVRATSLPTRSGPGVTMGASALAIVGAAFTIRRNEERRS